MKSELEKSVKILSRSRRRSLYPRFASSLDFHPQKRDLRWQGVRSNSEYRPASWRISKRSTLVLQPTPIAQLCLTSLSYSTTDPFFLTYKETFAVLKGSAAPKRRVFFPNFSTRTISTITFPKFCAFIYVYFEETRLLRKWFFRKEAFKLPRFKDTTKFRRSIFNKK